MIPGDLELTVVQAATELRGYLAGFAITDQLIVAVGGLTNRCPTVIASSNAREFESRTTPGPLGLRDVLAVGDALWVCGEHGQLARTRDHGATWTTLATGTDGCLYGLAVAADGVVWVVGDHGYVARVLGETAMRVDLETEVRLSGVYAVRDEMVVLGFDGRVRRWRAGAVTVVETGTAKPLTSLALTRTGTWVIAGDAGFAARSPDGSWFSRVGTGVDVDLEGVAALPDGRLVAVGGRAQILVSGDDGRTWSSLPSLLGLVHLWSVERFGDGVLIGGDDGLVVKLAKRGDAAWSDRANVFGSPRPLDEAFAAGPLGFIAHGLDVFLATQTRANEAPDDDDDDEHEDVDDDDDDRDREAFAVLARAGDATDFRAIYGVELPAEAARLFAAMRGHDPASTFEELRLDRALRPDVGERNLFELMVRRNQLAYLGTDLVEAFCGVFAIGSQGNGDSYHLEIYEWDGPRQVLHFDHGTRTFSGVLAESLDSLVYLASIVKAGADGLISRHTHDRGVRRLRGKVAPSWHFAIEDKDPDFVKLEPKRRDTEFFFYRSRWICALLQHDGVTTLADVPGLFMADLNQVIPADQLPARFEACERFIPTALYAMWRAYLFDEPELDRYLEIARAHDARLVRDAALLIDDLRGGRNQLGTITDVRAWLAAFRALDLDPRRAAEREAEAEARDRADVERKQALLRQLATTSRPQWTELAWQWVDDGIAHRALLEGLDRTEAATQIAAIDDLRDLGDDDRGLAIARIANELSPELEAVLVGSLVRDDRLAGVLSRPAAATGAAPASEHAPGWDAIDRVLEPIYGGVKPLHWGTAIPYLLGGNDPIHGISAYPRSEPVPHWHFVTYGFTDLFHKETDDPDESGFGFELTLRLARDPDDQAPPSWALNFLQNLGRYVFGTGNRFAAGHKMGLNGPIALDHVTKITAICFADDPELGAIESVHGKARFVQIVGITDDEYRLIQEWSTTGLVEILAQRLPFLVTDLRRASVLDDPDTAAEVEVRVAREGSSEDLTFAGELALEADDGRVRIEMGALYAAALPRAMRGRIRHGRPYELRGRGATLHLEPASSVGYRRDEDELVLEITQELAREIEVQLRSGLAGTYDFEAWPALEIVVTPSFIRAQDGTAAEVRGITDPMLAERMIDAENARVAAAAAGHVDDDDDEDDDEDAEDDNDDDDDDDGHAALARMRSALAMTERALRLAPDDTDVQFTHAMLLIDAERAQLPGKTDELLTWLARFALSVRINVAVRMGEAHHDRFDDAVELVLGNGSDAFDASSFEDVAHDLFTDLAEAIVAHAPRKLKRLVPLLPDDVTLLSELAFKATGARQRDTAVALYDRMLAVAFPDDADERQQHLRGLNNACVQAHAAGLFDCAVRIADHAQPVAHENPYIFHAAACAYAALGDHDRALEQVKLAIEHDYDHVGKIELDADLGALREWPEFKALFRDWHARQEGN